MKNKFIKYKREIAAGMAVLMLLVFAACGASKNASAQASAVQDLSVQAAEQEPEEAEPVIENLIDPSDPRYASAAEMADVLGAVGEYIYILPDLDIDNMDPDDFWNLMAIITTCTQPSESADQFGIYHVDTDTVNEYAATFFGAYTAANGIPSYSDTYSASSDSWSTTIDLLPIRVENYKKTLDHLESVPGNDSVFIASVYMNRVSEEEDEGETTDAAVSVQDQTEAEEAEPTYVMNFYLTEWNDGADHIFPYRVVDIQRGQPILSEA